MNNMFNKILYKIYKRGGITRPYALSGLTKLWNLNLINLLSKEKFNYIFIHHSK